MCVWRRVWTCLRDGCGQRNKYQLFGDGTEGGCHACGTLMGYTESLGKKGYHLDGSYLLCATDVPGRRCYQVARYFVFPAWQGMCYACSRAELDVCRRLLNGSCHVCQAPAAAVVGDSLALVCEDHRPAEEDDDDGEGGHGGEEGGEQDSGSETE